MIKSIIVYIRKFSIMIGSSCAYVSQRNWHSITWVYRNPNELFVIGYPSDLHVNYTNFNGLYCKVFCSFQRSQKAHYFYIIKWLLIYFLYASYSDILILSRYFEIFILLWYDFDIIMISFLYYQIIVDISFVCQLTVIFSYFDIIMIIIWHYQMIVDRTFKLHFMVIFWY